MNKRPHKEGVWSFTAAPPRKRAAPTPTLGKYFFPTYQPGDVKLVTENENNAKLVRMRQVHSRRDHCPGGEGKDSTGCFQDLLSLCIFQEWSFETNHKGYVDSLAGQSSRIAVKASSAIQAVGIRHKWSVCQANLLCQSDALDAWHYLNESTIGYTCLCKNIIDETVVLPSQV